MSPKIGGISALISLGLNDQPRDTTADALALKLIFGAVVFHIQKLF